MHAESAFPAAIWTSHKDELCMMFRKKVYTIEKTRQMVEFVIGAMENFMNEANWMDEKSRKESLKKLEFMGIYVGSPPEIFEGDGIDSYYDKLEVESSGYLENLAELLDFDVITLSKMFYGTMQDMTAPWPEC